MGIQIGFNGAIKIDSRRDIDAALELTLDRYRGYVIDVAHEPTPELVYWRIVFSMLSVHTHFAANVAAYEMIREEGTIPTDSMFLTALLSQVNAGGHVIQFAGQKATNLIQFQHAWDREHEPYMPVEDTREWRDNIAKLRGLARTKSSFAVCLAAPLDSEVICIDRHMANLLIGAGTGDRKLRVGEYDSAENAILRLARKYDAPPFAVQWCLWDAQRGSVEPHAVLKAA